ncbi:DUF7528 family protein, partial [Halolamina salina]
MRDDLTAALTGRREFVRTAGEHRPDGSYVVSRRGADSAGNAKQFRDFRTITALYDRLPGGFDASAVDGISIESEREYSIVFTLGGTVESVTPTA